MHALIIGAGIGGTTAAIALRHIGLDVTVCERAPEPREVGAGIALGANAMHCLKQLNAHQRILDNADRITTADLRDHRGRLLIHTPITDFERSLPAHSVLIHRADLLDALLSRLPRDIVQLNRACTRVTQDDSGVIAHFSDGSTERADLLIGADGIRSVVRSSLLGDEPPRYSGYTGWRGIAPGASLVPQGLTCEYWGRAARFGFGRCGHNRVYWYATRTTPPNGADEPDPHPALLAIFGDWTSPIPDLIKLTPPQAILRNDILDRPPSHKWGDRRISLLGDAAHPTTPNLGQGACMAIEDAISLAHHLKAATTQDAINESLRAHETTRMPRTAMITNTSWRLGNIGQWNSPFACAVRNRLFSLTPRRVIQRSHQRIAGHIETL